MRKLTLKKTDIIPLVNYSWGNSFGRVKNNKKALIRRGWNPPNRSILSDPEILRTKEDMTLDNGSPELNLPDCPKIITVDNLNFSRGFSGQKLSLLITPYRDAIE